MKRRRLEYLVWSRGMGKSDKYRLRHLVSQVVGLRLSAASVKIGNALGRHGWLSAQNLKSFGLDRTHVGEVRPNTN